MSTFNLSNRVKLVNASPNVDDDYGGPYVNMAAATTAIPTLLRKAGKTVGIYSGTEVKEYWWPDDLTLSSDPVLKFSNVPIINPEALTKVDDTNVTLTLGGTPNVALLAATSLTLGWTGKLANERIASADIWDGKQNAGDYVTSLTGEATATGPGPASVVLSNSAVISKTLTGVNITGGSIDSTDSILIAFGKVQNQLNGLIGATIYKGTWNASTNTPTLTSSVGVQGSYYIVNVAGSTNLNGITTWSLGDWAIFNGTVWQRVANTDAVISVNGQVGVVNLTTDNIPEGALNKYFTNTLSRNSLSFAAGSGNYDNFTGVITIPTNTNQLTNGSDFISLLGLSSLATGLTYTNTTGVFTLTSGYVIPTTTDEINWNAAYTNRITSASSPIIITSNVISHSSTDGNLHVPATSTTNNGKVLTAGPTAGSLSWQPPAAVVLTVVDIPGTTYLLDSADSGKILQFTSNSPITVTVPSGLVPSQRYLGKQLGTGQITFVGSGATLNKAPTEYLKTASQYSVFAIDWTSSETYMVYGRLELI
jgi:hypothetical protein